MAEALVGKAAPDFGMDDSKGAHVKMSQFLNKGKPIVIDFYTTWWGSCPASLKKRMLDVQLIALVSELAAEMHGKVEFFAVALETTDVMKKYVTANSYMAKFDHNAASKDTNGYHISYIPVCLAAMVFTF